MPISVTISGSFHRHLCEIMDAVAEFRDHRATVLSPDDPRVVESIGGFHFVASDPYRSIRLVEDVHLDAIRRSDLLWIVSPDGYIGQSVSLEMGFAIASGVPIYGSNLPPDLTLRQYVRVAPSIREALRAVTAHSPQPPRPSLLLEPDQVIDGAHDGLEQLRSLLHSNLSWLQRDIAPDVIARQSELNRSLVLPNT